MKNVISCIVLGLAVLCVACAAPIAEAADKKPVRVIYDTDFGGDCDDAGGLAVLHALADLGEARILATISVTGKKYAPGGIDAINTYYGRPDIPIGAPKADVWATSPPDRYAKELATNAPNDVKTKKNVPPAVSLYRKILSRQPDNSVVIVTVGFLRNMQNLLNSSPDQYSDLHGPELVRRKVRKLVCMACEFPKGHSWNTKGGPWNYGSATQRVVKDWPTQVTFTGFEVGYPIMTGHRLATETSESNPVFMAYDGHPGVNKEGDRHSWDLTAVLLGVRGPSDYWTVEDTGHLMIRNNGANEWIDEPDDSRVGYVVQKMPVPQMEKVLGDLLVQDPAKR